MPDHVRRVSYFYVEVSDRPGEGAKFFEKLREARVNLLAFTAFPTGGGKAQVDVVPQDPNAFLAAAKRFAWKYAAPKEAFLLQGGDRVGVVADVLGKLAGAKLNVTAANACAAPGGGFGMIVWVKPEDVPAAARALGV